MTKVKVGFTVKADIGDARKLHPFAEHLADCVMKFWDAYSKEHGIEFDVEVGPVKLTGSRR